MMFGKRKKVQFVTSDSALREVSSVPPEVGPGTVEITGALLEAVMACIKEIGDSAPAYVECGMHIYAEMPYEARLALLAYFFQALVQHGIASESYRVLLYERLGLNPDAYGLLQYCGALDVHNAVYESSMQHEEDDKVDE